MEKPSAKKRKTDAHKPRQKELTKISGSLRSFFYIRSLTRVIPLETSDSCK